VVLTFYKPDTFPRQRSPEQHHRYTVALFSKILFGTPAACNSPEVAALADGMNILYKLDRNAPAQPCRMFDVSYFTGHYEFNQFTYAMFKAF